MEISDGELETAVSEYHVCSTEVVGRFSEMLDGKRILGKAQSGVVSTGSEEPLLGWEDVFSDVVDRALEENDDLPRRDIVRELFKALCEATPGENKYSARIELVNPS